MRFRRLDHCQQQGIYSTEMKLNLLNIVALGYGVTQNVFFKLLKQNKTRYPSRGDYYISFHFTELVSPKILSSRLRKVFLPLLTHTNDNVIIVFLHGQDQAGVL